MHNLCSVVDTRLGGKTVSSKFGAEYSGACPWCGGNDRFHVWPDANEDIPAVGNLGRWWCMDSSVGRAGCGRKGDMISYVAQRDGVAFRDACERLGIDPHLIIAYRREQQNLPPEEKKPWLSNGELALPFADLSEKWRDTAWFMAYRLSLFLPQFPQAKDYLLSRGLSEQTIEEEKIGFYPR